MQKPYNKIPVTSHRLFLTNNPVLKQADFDLSAICRLTTLNRLTMFKKILSDRYISSVNKLSKIIKMSLMCLQKNGSGAIYQIDNNNQRLNLYSYYNTDAKFLPYMENIHFCQSWTGKVAVTGQTRIFNDIQEVKSEMSTPLIKMNYNSGISLPIKHEAQVEGVMDLLIIEKHVFWDTEIKLLESICALLGNFMHKNNP